MISVSGIVRSLLADRTVDVTLPDLLCIRCADHLGVTGVGIALMSDDGHQGVVGASDPRARAVEELQYTTGEGPCLDSSSGGLPVLAPDLLGVSAAQWPGFVPSVIEAGVLAIFAFPLQIGGIRLGVLDVYRDQPGPLVGEEFADALTYADAAGVLLLHLQHQMGPDEGLHPQLIDPLGYRPEVHQATGMVSVQASVGLADALLLLRARSFATETPIHELARAVLDRRIRFTLGDPDDE